MTFDPQPFDILLGLQNWAVLLGVAVGLAVLVGLLVSLIVHRGRAFGAFAEQTARLSKDAVHISPRRVWALSMLTFREGIRRKALLVGIVFAILFMFAGWFLSDANTRPELQVKVYVSFVLTTISFLLLPMVMLLACWGLPEDIKARSLHTVVTKPARRHEVFLGRIFGFTMIGTLLLAVMGTVGYVWIWRQIPKDVRDKELVCRVPVYGELSFLDRQGVRRDRGINVGDVWDFRSFIAGGTKARAIWTFQNVSRESLGDKLRLESRFEVFRTHKGIQKQGVMCEFHFVKDLRSQTARYLAPGLGPRAKELHDAIAQSRFKTIRVPQAAKSRTGQKPPPQNPVFVSAVGSVAGPTLPSQAANAMSKRETKTPRTKEIVGAADVLRSIATAIDNGQLRLGAGNFEFVEDGYASFAELMAPFLDSEPEDADWIKELIGHAEACSDAAREQQQGDLVEPMKAIADIFEQRDARLKELLVDVVARHDKPFPVPEFRDSYNTTVDPSEIYYTINGGEVRIDGEKRIRGNLFDDLVHGGKLHVHVQCLDRGQYVGMARPDLFIRRPDREFYVGYSKAILSVWLLMVLVVTLSVTASTFLKGPVATLLTFVIVILGSFFYGFLEEVATGQLDSAGAWESAYRLVNHQNPRSEIGDTTVKKPMEVVDNILLSQLKVVYRVIPNFKNYRAEPYVANGFDVPWNSALLPALLTTLGFLVPCLLLGYLSLASRELEDK